MLQNIQMHAQQIFQKVKKVRNHWLESEIENNGVSGNFS